MDDILPAKVTKRYISDTTGPIPMKFGLLVAPHDVIKTSNFCIKIFRGLRYTRSHNPCFLIDFAGHVLWHSLWWGLKPVTDVNCVVFGWQWRWGGGVWRGWTVLCLVDSDSEVVECDMSELCGVWLTVTVRWRSVTWVNCVVFGWQWQWGGGVWRLWSVSAWRSVCLIVRTEYVKLSYCWQTDKSHYNVSQWINIVMNIPSTLVLFICVSF